MTPEDIDRIGSSFAVWRMHEANGIGTIEEGDGRLVTLAHAPNISTFSPKDPVIRISYEPAGRNRLDWMIKAHIQLAKTRRPSDTDEHRVPVFPLNFRGAPVRYYLAIPVPKEESGDPRQETVTTAQWDESKTLAERFEAEIWRDQGRIEGLGAPLTLCSVSGFGINAAQDTPVISVLCVPADHPDAPSPIVFPRSFGGLAVEYRLIAGGPPL